MNKTKKLAYLSLAAAAALILSYVESLLPPLYPAVPGVKTGLANIAVTVALWIFGIREAAAVSVVRISLSALLFGNFTTFIYSLAGAALSIVVMALLKKTRQLSPIGVSAAGGVAHNLGQVLAALFLLKTPSIMYYMTVLTVTGTVAGLLVGCAGALLIRFIEKNNIIGKAVCK